MFLFMNRLRTTVFKNALSIVAQADAGRTIKQRGTILAQQLVAKSAVYEKQYYNGTIKATELLQESAAHYDNQKLDNFFKHAADEEFKNQATGTETPTLSN